MMVPKQTGQSVRYMVYDCTQARGSTCYGWSDRIAGIVTTFIISILSRRQFLISFDTPCLLEDFLAPGDYDWRYNSSVAKNRSSSFHDLNNVRHKKIYKHMLGISDFNNYFKDDVIFLLMNWDYINTFRLRIDISREISWITKYHQADIYKHVYNFLFKLSPFSVRALHERYLTKRKRSKIACAHIRIGRNPNMPSDVTYKVAPPLITLWKYFDTLNKEEYDLFVATDTDSVKTEAKTRYPDNLIEILGNITHIDQTSSGDPREGFLTQLLDFYILIGCDVLIISNQSGFSLLAAYLRDRDDDLFCWRGRNLIPCSRHTAADVIESIKFRGGQRPTLNGKALKRAASNA
ncbi:uncharacterized protein [Argopecten irradians]|uniref:uncharacterized protein n=1 Tax=Argopecten irradians TaxID=31199 RepID=UPI00371819AA